MGEWLKIALKAGLVVVFMLAIWGVLANLPAGLVTIPNIFFSYIGKVKAIGEYFAPGFGVFLGFCFGGIAVRLAGLLFKLTANVGKWLYQIFE